MLNEALRRVIDPSTVRVTPAAKALAEQVARNATLIAEHRRQTNKATMDSGEDHFFTQRQHLSEFFRLCGEQQTLLRRFKALETRALAVQLARKIIGLTSR